MPAAAGTDLMERIESADTGWREAELFGDDRGAADGIVMHEGDIRRASLDSQMTPLSATAGAGLNSSSTKMV